MSTLNARLYLTEPHRLAKEGKLADACVEYVREMDYTTFVELSNFLSGYINTKGQAAIEFPNLPNAILWAGMSEEFVDVVIELQRSGKLEPHPADMLTYLTDGGLLQLPIARRPPKGGYKEPHWLPICFRVKGSSENGG